MQEKRIISIPKSNRGHENHLLACIWGFCIKNAHFADESSSTLALPDPSTFPTPLLTFLLTVETQKKPRFVVQ